MQGGIPRVADFVHGSDGLGNTFLAPPKSKKFEKSACEFLVDKVNEYPGEVSILALGPLTNLALVSTEHCIYQVNLNHRRIIYISNDFWLGCQKRLILCKEGEEGGGTWWIFLCIGQC